MSLGGYLSLRAAAYEKRVKRVIVYDILADFFDVLTHQIDPGFRDTFKDMINKGNKDEVNTVLKTDGKELNAGMGYYAGNAYNRK